MQSSAQIHVNEDGTVTVVEGSPDIGGSRASMALMAAEELGVPYEQVRVPSSPTRSPSASTAARAVRARPSPRAWP
jgi:CO/xanthine dehydrogenase Mo-binding subunit